MRNIAVLIVLGIGLIATDAQARHTGSFTGRRGNTTSWTTNVTGRNATGSITGPKGNTTSGSATATPEGGGSYGVDGTVTGPRGTPETFNRTVTPQ